MFVTVSSRTDNVKAQPAKVAFHEKSQAYLKKLSHILLYRGIKEDNLIQ